MTTIEAPAKLNLCLFVGRPRADGYHPLVSVFQSVTLTDTLAFAPADRDEVVCPGVEGDNLAMRALAASRAAGWDGPPVRVTITKRIPVAAGLGGGSADAAAVLRFTGVHHVAASLGADVPFQLAQGRALVTGIGERVEPLPPGPPPAFVVLPSVHQLSTPAVYAEADRLETTREDLATPERDLRAGGAIPYVNDLEPAARSLQPDIDRALQRLQDAGADAVLVAGSGPTTVGVFDDPERAAAAAARLPGALAVEPVA